MFDKFSRSLDMLKRSAEILNQDRELLVFPLLSSIAAVMVLISFAPLFFLESELAEAPDQLNLFVFLLFYLVEYFVIFFFNSALVGAALIRMDGGDPTVMDGRRIAGSKFTKILGYAALAATVGLFLRTAGERMGIIGRFMAGIVGIAWTVASFLAVPVLVSRDVGPIDAVKESARLLKDTWGENVISNAGIGIVFMAVYFASFLIGGILISLASTGGSSTLVFTLIGILIVWFVLLGLLQAALQGIFSAVLYRFATDGEQTGGFSNDALSHAFAPK